MTSRRVARALAGMTMLAFAFLLTAPSKSAAQVLNPPTDFSQLKELQFDFDQYKTPVNMDALRTDAEWLKAHPQIRFYVNGYTDPRGDVVYNMALAQRRADTIKNLLAAEGVSTDRMVDPAGWGKLYQTCQDATEECWYQNRRVTFGFAGGTETSSGD